MYFVLCANSTSPLPISSAEEQQQHQRPIAFNAKMVLLQFCIPQESITLPFMWRKAVITVVNVSRRLLLGTVTVSISWKYSIHSMEYKLCLPFTVITGLSFRQSIISIGIMGTGAFWRVLIAMQRPRACVCCATLKDHKHSTV